MVMEGGWRGLPLEVFAPKDSRITPMCLTCVGSVFSQLKLKMTEGK